MKLKNIHLQIPNLLTLTNLLFGCIGIIYAFDEKYFVLTRQGEIDSIEEVRNRLFTSCLLLFAAAIIDFFDGFIARALKAESKIGKDLDSLADVVTFGVLPGMIFYQLLERSYFSETFAMHTSKWHEIIAMCIPLAAAYRLARFNTVETSKEYFTGLATPAMAIFTASLPLMLLKGYIGFGSASINMAPLILNKYILNVTIVIFSYLMISDVKMFSLKFQTFGFKENIRQYVFLLLCLTCLIVPLLLFKDTNDYNDISSIVCGISPGIAFSILLYIFFSLFVIRFKTNEEELTS